MPADADPPVAPRQQRRKAETRRKIVTAADRLFAQKGYAHTSIEEIADAADVAVRTIYLHFESKAAIMLTYFDEWVDDFVEAVLARPVEEPVLESVTAALAAMSEAGWVDRVEGADQLPHPLVEYVGSGSLDVAGHVLQRWMGVMTRISHETAARSEAAADSIDPQARAVGVFTVWIGAIFGARERVRIGVPGDSVGTGPAILARLLSGTV